MTTQFFLLLIGAVLLLGSILLTPLSTRIGIPVLLLFLGVGIIAGEDGPGGIQFDNYDITFLVGNLALAVILLDGGMRTRKETFRVALKPAALLATVGVAITAGLTGLTALWLFDLPPMVALLMGAIVSSTDAAAVFAMLHGRGLNLNERVSATLEIESGSNDPMAIFLTVMLLEVIQSGHNTVDWMALTMLLEQFGIGIAIGIAGGWLLTLMVRQLRLVNGLYPLLVVTTGIAVFSLTGLLGGSGFMAVYITGLWLGNSGHANLSNIMQAHDGLAWLAQLTLFLILGLLVVPSQMVDHLAPALGVAAVLILVARPLAVFTCLLPFRMNLKEQAYIAWVGLRGAVPIVLALFPTMAQIPEASLLFNVTFAVVLISLLVQGTTLAPLARRLGLEVPAPALPRTRVSLQGNHELYLIPALDLDKTQTSPSRLSLPQGCALLALLRDDELLKPRSETSFQPQDILVLSGSPHLAPQIGRMFGAREKTEKTVDSRFFGQFVLSGDTRLDALKLMYGVAVDDDIAHLTLSQFIVRYHRRHPVVGDKCMLPPFVLTVYEVDGDKVIRVGMKLPETSDV